MIICVAYLIVSLIATLVIAAALRMSARRYPCKPGRKLEE